MVRRILLWFVLPLMVLTAVFFAGGGWYFAGEIRSDGLVVRHGPTEYNLVVVSASDGSVTLREAAGQERDANLRSTATYGLQWPGGSGVLGPVRVAAGDAVARPLTVKTGSAPRPGVQATLNKDVFVDPLSAHGTRFQNVSYGCAGGRCPAWFVPGTSTTWAVMVHGKGGTRSEPLRALGTVVDAKMPALLVTYRNDVGAPPDPSGYYRYGDTEWQDVDSAVGYALAQGARRVVLFGWSMGGGIVASFLEHSPRANRVTGVVLDSPMLDFRRTVEYGASQRDLPVVGLPVPPPLTTVATAIAGWRYDIAWDRIDYLDGGWLRVPTLIYHGTADLTVPIATSDDLARRRPDLVREVRVAGAEHTESWNADPGDYTAQLASYLAPLAR
ncbi:MAG TPA: hypothetical protein VGR21_04595 [Cryptosporangiaceae bacterium]|nr:hypothetical protein [Cryptosporangiaceae bacterium]